ncbi:MAG: hypothetical protein A3C47_07285 [Omnitrophica bacterium RIFCSPHIGHO2_02_FULL_51_18]|nr:MAG: hypothetical protein A3C47_07285 [Omnitrophica bacterium RIFCSPHIGHO2_02_FULL_51_18]
MKFEYDQAKSEANVVKHGISLEEAKVLWSMPESVEIKARSIGEERLMIINRLEGKFYSCVFTRRGEAVRLISFRRSRKYEEELFYGKIRKSQIH